MALRSQDWGFKTYANDVDECMAIIHTLAGRFTNYAQGPDFSDFKDERTRNAVADAKGLLSVTYNLIIENDDRRGYPRKEDDDVQEDSR